jgi:uncharacterized protein (DUF2236 family)
MMPEVRRRKAGEIAVLRRFPAERPTIEELIVRDGDFCEMCQELAAAELALIAAEVLPPAIRDARTIEWAAAIDRLAAEIGRALKEANVIDTG